jgi:hypothetical protein
LNKKCIDEQLHKTKIIENIKDSKGEFEKAAAFWMLYPPFSPL